MINLPENSLPYHIRSAFRGFETALARYLVRWNLPLSHFYILRLQWDENGNTQTEIAKKACMSESVTSQVIQKMEKTGIVKRKSVKGDSRKRGVYLTAKGEALRNSIINDGIKISNEHSPNISRDDMLTTISVLSEVTRAFEVYNTRNDERA